MPSTETQIEATSVLFPSLGSYWSTLQNERPIDANQTLAIDPAIQKSESFQLGRNLVEKFIVDTMGGAGSGLARWRARQNYVGELKQLLASPDLQLSLSASLFAYCANTSDFFHPDDYFEAARLYIAAQDFRRAGEAYLAAASNPSSLLSFELAADVYMEAANLFVRAGEIQLADYALFMRIELASKNGDYGRKLVFMKELLKHFRLTQRPIFATQLSAQIQKEAAYYQAIARHLADADSARRIGDARGEISAMLMAADKWLDGRSVEYAKKCYLQAIRVAENAGLLVDAGKLRLELVDTFSGSSVFSYREQAEILFSASQNFRRALETFHDDQRGKIVAADILSFRSFSKAISYLLPFALHPSTGTPDKERVVAMIKAGASGDEQFFNEMRGLLWPTVKEGAKFSLKNRAEKRATITAYLEIAYAASERMLDAGNGSLALRFMFEALGDVKSLTYPGSECRAMAGNMTLGFAQQASTKMARPFSLIEKTYLWYVKKTLRRDLLLEKTSVDDLPSAAEVVDENKLISSSKTIADGIAVLEERGEVEAARIARLKNLGPALEAEGKYAEAIALYEQLSDYYLIETKTKKLDDNDFDRKNAILADALCCRGRLMLQHGDVARGDDVHGRAVLNAGYSIYAILLKNDRANTDSNSRIFVRAMTELLRAGWTDYAFTLMETVAVPKSVSAKAVEHVLYEVVLKELNGDRALPFEFLKRAEKIVGGGFWGHETMESIRRAIVEGCASDGRSSPRRVSVPTETVGNYSVATSRVRLGSESFAAARLTAESSTGRRILQRLRQFFRK